MRATLKTLMICFLALTATVAIAQTPDGETPAEETICTDAGLTGAAWGLCNAYCEAMDCHCFADLSCVPNASQKACDRVQANYEKKTLQPMPCLQAACPCLDRTQWTDETWVDIVDAQAPDTVCSASGNTTSASIGTIAAIVVADGANSFCQSQETSNDPPTILDTLGITGDEATACAAVLTNLCS